MAVVTAGPFLDKNGLDALVGKINNGFLPQNVTFAEVWYQG